jgi:hypothetical protein
VAACNAARRHPGEQPLLPCRYHLFVSALEGLFVDLASDAELADSRAPREGWEVPALGLRRLAVRRLRPEDGRQALELARCQGCGFPFVVLDPAPAQGGLDQPPVWERPVSFFAFEDLGADGAPLEAARVDLRGGKAEGAAAGAAPGAAPPWRTLYAVPPSADRTDVRACPHCGRRHGNVAVAGRFLTGQDIPVSILTEALYEQLPELPTEQRDRLQQALPHRFNAGSDPLVGGGRKLLIFSDSRQNAAFMASFLQDHATTGLFRELAYDAVWAAPAGPLTLGDWAQLIMQQIKQRRLHVPYLEERDLTQLQGSLFRGSYLTGVVERKNRLLHHLLAELTGNQPLCLGALGLLDVVLLEPLPEELTGEPATVLEASPAQPGGPLTVSELLDLLDRVFGLVRRQYLVTTPGGVEPPGFGKGHHCLVLEKPEDGDDALHGMWMAGGQDTLYAAATRSSSAVVTCHPPAAWAAWGGPRAGSPRSTRGGAGG